jgi:hypothetical protein
VTCDAFRGDVDVTFAHTRATKTTRTMDSVMRQSMRYATTRRRGRDAGEDGRTVGLDYSCATHLSGPRTDGFGSRVIIDERADAARREASVRRMSDEND